MKKLQYLLVSGKEVPYKARRLTLGDSGVMETWLDTDREEMTAYLVYEGTKLIAWGAYVHIQPSFFIFNRNTVGISVFVMKKYRSRGIGMELLRKLLSLLARRKPKAKVRYGAIEDYNYFNDVYRKEIVKRGLKPIRWFT